MANKEAPKSNIPDKGKQAPKDSMKDLQIMQKKMKEYEAQRKLDRVKLQAQEAKSRALEEQMMSIEFSTLFNVKDSKDFYVKKGEQMASYMQKSVVDFYKDAKNFAGNQKELIGKYWENVAAQGYAKGVETVAACVNAGITVPKEYWSRLGKQGADKIVQVAQDVKAKGVVLNNRFWDGALQTSLTMKKEALKVYIAAAGDVKITVQNWKNFFDNVSITTKEVGNSLKAAANTVGGEFVKNAMGSYNTYLAERERLIKNSQPVKKPVKK